MLNELLMNGVSSFAFCSQKTLYVDGTESDISDQPLQHGVALLH